MNVTVRDKLVADLEGYLVDLGIVIHDLREEKDLFLIIGKLATLNDELDSVKKRLVQISHEALQEVLKRSE